MDPAARNRESRNRCLVDRESRFEVLEVDLVVSNEVIWNQVLSNQVVKNLGSHLDGDGNDS